PPAAGPSTTEICGTRPEARTIAAKICPIPSSASTPSGILAPPEGHSPMTGTRSRTAVATAATMCRRPSYPRAPPILVPSVANAITGAPLISPRAYCTPEVSFGRNRRREPWSKSDRRRSSGSRWSTGAESVDVAAVMLMAATSVSGEEQRDVVTAEAERVVQGGRDLHLARLVGGHVQIESVVRVVQVDRGGHHAVA